MIILGREISERDATSLKDTLVNLIELNRGVSFADLRKEGCELARAVDALPDTSHLERVKRFDATEGPWLYNSVVRLLQERGCPVAV